MGMYFSFNTSENYQVRAISNSTIVSFEFLESNRTIKIFVYNSTASQVFGFCRVSIPHELMSEPYNVTVNGANPVYWNYSIFDDGENRVIYFAFEHSKVEIVIVHEFSFNLFIIYCASVLALIIINKRKSFHDGG